ncbi:helix-turn-helix domain-containing protein [Streptomyces avicenniae]|uniref:helix-turn-helix domain-containing protein n=1 Tax=Streptomyces avicenniae TaxID=500153 RepID=UPI00069BEA87|nr:helix-turn-helix transcriptional regulator [Streptomyces avicenniae]
MAVVANVSPLAARRRLGAELRRLRDGAALTAEEVGAHLNCHNSKVSRIELGKRACAPADFEGFMNLYEVTGEQRDDLADLMRRGRQRIPPWWSVYGDVISANYAEFLAYEAEAVRGSEFQSLLIPGLLQTEEYAHAVTARGYALLGPDQVESLVEVRMRRQERLHESDPLVLEATVTEAALRLQIGGPSVMRAQLRRLQEVVALPNVTFGVIPFEAGERAVSTGAFSLFATDKDGEPDVAFTESAEATTTLRDDPRVTRRLSRVFKRLSDAALPLHATLELLQRIESELT